LGRVGRLVGRVSWVEEIGPTDGTTLRRVQDCQSQTRRQCCVTAAKMIVRRSDENTVTSVASVNRTEPR